MKSVGFFASCPVDLFRPSVGFASVELLEQAGFTVHVPPQSCCGQVNFNNGVSSQARQLAWNLITTFEPFDYTVIPSGSCGGMIKHHYPELFQDDPRLPRVLTFCEKVFELTDFLVTVAEQDLTQRLVFPNAQSSATRSSANPLSEKSAVITYHDSCAGLREMGIKQQPRKLLKACGVAVSEMVDTEVCCGFGGTFCVKHAQVSARMADNKIDNALAVNADLVIGGDLSCLLNLAGRAKRRGANLNFRHVAEVLVGDWQTPAIGEADEQG
ncbi:(Fe-S)-binding protein [Halioxenophilus sp. WMMB6]|uniref:(Fe-S)-binding protein n=1 Tax=Halioxenophilus sp. WMMB6 TaxID=3073815 RepID=UPI00295E3BC9|nr:(Fe-S)-binding protein [Halioxenophilus sp. WMMB6]